MIQNFNDFWQVVISTGIIFLVMLLLFRKHIVHLFDPLLFYLVTQAFSIELAFLVIDNPAYLINFLGCQIFFLIGFFSFSGKGLSKTDFRNSRLFNSTTPLQTSVVKWYAIFGAALLIIANIIQMKVNGIVLFSDNPSEAKVTSFTGGSGIVRRLDWGMLYVVGLCLLILFVQKKQIKYSVLFLFILFIPALGGSKGALLYFILLIALLNCFNDVKSNSFFKKLQVGSVFLLAIAIVLAGVIIYYSQSAQTYNDILFKLAGRFLFYGDSMIYYYDRYSVQYFSHYNFFDFVADEFNSVLGSFRLVPYSQPLGYRLINYYFNINSDTFGPSIPYYIKGNIYFGFYGAFIYSFIIGGIIGFVRRCFYALVKNGSSSFFYALLMIHLNLFIYTLPQDSPVFISVLFDTVFLSLPIVAVVLYMHFFPVKQPAVSNR